MNASYKLDNIIYRLSRSQPARRMLIPLVRSYFRFFPGQYGKENLWVRWVEPYFAWEHYRFVARTVFGRRFAGDTADMVQQYLYYFGLWEAELTAWISGRLRSGDTFIDVGANIGYYALLGASLVGRTGAVVAIEAAPWIFREMQANLALNNLPNVRAVNVAASDSKGTVQLFCGPSHNSGATGLFPIEGGHAEGTVAAAPLREILTRQELASARLIKIDVEGAEWKVLQGWLPSFGETRPDLELIIELHPQRLGQQGLTPESIIDLLSRHGLHPYHLANSYWPFSWHKTALARPIRVKDPIREEAMVVFSREDREQL